MIKLNSLEAEWHFLFVPSDKFLYKHNRVNTCLSFTNMLVLSMINLELVKALWNRWRENTHPKMERKHTPNILSSIGLKLVKN